MPYKKKENLFSKTIKKQNLEKNINSEISDELVPFKNGRTKKVKKPYSKPIKQIVNEVAAEVATEIAIEKAVKIKKTGSLMWKIISIAMIVLFLSGGGVFTYFSIGDYKTEVINKESDVLSIMDRVIIPEGHFDVDIYDFTYLSQMKAAKVTPGVDLYLDPATTAEQLNAEVDKLLENALTLGFNSLIVDTKLNDSVIYTTDSIKTTDVDLLKIIIDKATEFNISVVAVFNATGMADKEGIVIDSYLGGNEKNTTYKAAADLTNYQIDSVLIDDYYVERNSGSYDKFVEYGGVGDYNDWIYQNTQSTITGIVAAVENSANSKATGLLVKDVWADSEVNEMGSKTVSEFSALTDGYVDTKMLIENKAVRFASVEIDTSLTNKNQSFDEISKWWSAICDQSGMPMYITHSGENANNAELTGWAGTDQLARQASTVAKLPQFHGSAYSGIDSMIEDMDTSTEDLLEYYEGTYAEEDLFQDLEMFSPKPGQTNLKTYEETYQFKGKYDPTEDVFLNGEKVEPSEKGGFSEYVALDVGHNQIVMEHKGVKQVFNIEREVIIFDKWLPAAGDMTVSGSAQLEFNVVAYKDSAISATLNGTTIALVEQEGRVESTLDKNYSDSNYRNYIGYYTIPRATAKEQPIGAISFYGEYQGYKESKAGANITIDKLPDEVDPDEATGKILQHATVNSTYAYTYPFNTTPAYPQGILYQLPQGTSDIVQSINGDFVNLRSGKTVHANDVSLSEVPFVGNNSINSFSATVEGNDTVLRLGMGWKAPFSVNISPYPSAPEKMGHNGKGFSFTGNTVTVLLDYANVNSTANVVDALSSSPMFTGMTTERVKNEERGIFQYKITMTLRQAGVYYGVDARYEGNDLVMKFNHGPSGGGLSGVKILVDPGHGGIDNGTSAGRDTLEKDINLILAPQVADALRALGADVVMSRTTDETIADPNRLERFYGAQPDMILSIHHNSMGANSQPNGIETFFNAPFSQPLALSIQNELKNHSANRGAKFGNYFMIRGKQCPSVLIEYGFLSNPGDEANALNPAWQDAVAKATAQGVLNYYS